MEICVKVSLLFVSFFQPLKHVFLYLLISPISRLSLKHGNWWMTSQIMSCIQYSVSTNNILKLLYTNIWWKKSIPIDRVSIRFNDNYEMADFFRHSCIHVVDTHCVQHETARNEHPRVGDSYIKSSKIINWNIRTINTGTGSRITNRLQELQTVCALTLRRMQCSVRTWNTIRQPPDQPTRQQAVWRLQPPPPIPFTHAFQSRQLAKKHAKMFVASAIWRVQIASHAATRSDQK